MNRIELYVDRDDRLTIDFFFDSKDDYYMKRMKGKECYNFISQICERPILGVSEYSKTDLSINFKNCVLNVGEYELTFKKRGTGPVKNSLVKFYNNEKKIQSDKPKKVTRKNKHVNKKIIAGALAFALLGALMIKGLSNNKKSDKIAPKESTSYVNETETTRPENLPANNTAYEKEQNNSISINLNDIKSNLEDKIVSDVTINISYEDRSNTEKAQITRAYYGDVIQSYAQKYGLNPQLLIAIATQERGVHSTVKDSGGATGLMQIQNAVWANQKLTAYNYELGEYETITVNEDMLSDVFYNIKVGCMYFQNCLDYMNNNVLAAIQCYNMGYANMMAIMNTYAGLNNKTLGQVLNNTLDCGWMDHRDIIDVGDIYYLEHVLSWIGSEVNFQNIDHDGNRINLNITNQNQTKLK